MKTIEGVSGGSLYANDIREAVAKLAEAGVKANKLTVGRQHAQRVYTVASAVELPVSSVDTSMDPYAWRVSGE